MVDVIIKDGSVLTMDSDRTVITDGAVAVQDSKIVAVGPTDEILAAYEADTVVDASGKAVLPGFIDVHTHISSIILRGGNTSNRTLYDWLFNITKPARDRMTPEEHAIATELFCREAVEAGITTLVESAVGGGSGYPDSIVDRKMAVYERAGIRNMYAQSFIDEQMEPEIRGYVERLMEREPEVDAPSSPLVDTEEALANAEQLMQRYHGTRDGRQEVWSGPLSPRSTTPEGLRGAYRLAEEYDAMTTTHVSETTHEEAAVGGSHQTMVEYLHDIDYLGERALLAHCVHVSDRDIRLLANTGTRVAHNIAANLALGAGIAPVERMRAYGIPVGIGTDNATTSDAIDMLGDARMAMLTQRGHHCDPTILEPIDALEMITIDAAEVIGKRDELGSIEPGKKADIGIVDMDHVTGTPAYEMHSSVLFQAYRERFSTVICNGNIVFDETEVHDRYQDDLLDQARSASTDLLQRTGIAEPFEGIE